MKDLPSQKKKKSQMVFHYMEVAVLNLEEKMSLCTVSLSLSLLSVEGSKSSC